MSPAAGSPPLDYFVYTSQLAAAPLGPISNVSISSFLPPLESIYAPPPQAGAGAPTAHQQQLAARVLALVANTSHSHDNNLVDLEATRLAWSLMERQAALYIKNRVLTLRPYLNELLVEARVSAECHTAIGAWLDQLQELRHWATLMWNSWAGFPPSGLFEGSFTDLGSYRGCMRVQDNDAIGQAQYCMLDFQPLVPTRPRFHSIFKRILGHQDNQLTGGDFSNLAPGERISASHTAHGFASTRFNQFYAAGSSHDNDLQRGLANKYTKRTIVHNVHPSAANTSQPAGQQHAANLTLTAEALVELAQKAQYFYYVKFRLGACLPSKCSVNDVNRLAQTGKYASSRVASLSGYVHQWLGFWGPGRAHKP